MNLLPKLSTTVRGKFFFFKHLQMIVDDGKLCETFLATGTVFLQNYFQVKEKL